MLTFRSLALRRSVRVAAPVSSETIPTILVTYAFLTRCPSCAKEKSSGVENGSIRKTSHSSNPTSRMQFIEKHFVMFYMVFSNDIFRCVGGFGIFSDWCLGKHGAVRPRVFALVFFSSKTQSSALHHVYLLMPLFLQLCQNRFHVHPRRIGRMRVV